MALISARTIITSISLFHITLGFFFITNPATVADQALVYVMGEAMGMPYARSFESQSAPLAFLGAILAFMGLSDLVTLSLPEEICLIHYWGSQAPLRMMLAFALNIYTFLFSASSPFYSSSSTRGRMAHPSAHAHNPSYRASTWGGDGLKNRVFFTFMFVETVSWFWIWVTLREERSALQARKLRRRNSHKI